MEFGFEQPNILFLEKEVWTFERPWITLTLGCHKSSCTHLLTICTPIFTGFNSFLEI